MRKKTSGFTLLELVIAILIVAIIATSATEIYSNYLRKGRRLEILADMLSIQIAEEAYRLTHSQYATLSQVMDQISTTSHSYDLSIADVSATTYNIKATALNEQMADGENTTSCHILTLSVKNGVVKKTPNICWEE